MPSILASISNEKAENCYSTNAWAFTWQPAASTKGVYDFAHDNMGGMWDMDPEMYVSVGEKRNHAGQFEGHCKQ